MCFQIVRNGIFTWTSKSPKNQPTSEVKAFVVMGFSSRALLYEAQPGTAPPRVKAGSRKRALVVEGDFVRREDVRAGLKLLDIEAWLLTPNAEVVKQVTDTSNDVSFIFSYLLVNCKKLITKYILCYWCHLCVFIFSLFVWWIFLIPLLHYKRERPIESDP